MCDVENDKKQSRFLFISILVGMIYGVLGNLLVTSSFETLKYYNISEISSIPIVDITLCISIILLIFLSFMAWSSLKETLR